MFSVAQCRHPPTIIAKTDKHFLAIFPLNSKHFLATFLLNSTHFLATFLLNSTHFLTTFLKNSKRLQTIITQISSNFLATFLFNSIHLLTRPFAQASKRFLTTLLHTAKYFQWLQTFFLRRSFLHLLALQLLQLSLFVDFDLTLQIC